MTPLTKIFGTATRYKQNYQKHRGGMALAFPRPWFWLLSSIFRGVFRSNVRFARIYPTKKGKLKYHLRVYKQHFVINSNQS